jgi:hypothetical protein
VQTKSLALMVAGGSALVVWLTGYAVLAKLSPAPHAARVHDHASHRGGTVQSAGDNHIELVAETGGRLRLYLLGRDEATLNPIAAAELIAEARTPAGLEVTRLPLRAEPQPGEAPGTAAQFAGQLPPELRGRPVEVAVNVPINGKTYRVRFTPETRKEEAAHAESVEEDSAMPAANLSDAEERALFLTPGGLYTQADIDANGEQIPSIKFRGIQAAHVMNPKPGARVCPITNTLANPKFTWIVNGKAYPFCCPPCVTEFVKLAKTDPKAIRPPESYVKR